jgi:hypothetical protein
MNTKEKTVEAFRLAIREEGPQINAYMAQLGTMDGARKLGSIETGLCKLDRDVFESFKTTMQLGLAALTREAIGHDVVGFDERRPPEHERSGHS